MKSIWLVALGGAFGASARYGVSLLAARLGASWPLGTFSANLLGCTLMGLLAGLFMGRTANPVLMLTLGTGFLGGFTTLSAVSLETVTLLEQGQPAKALLYAVGTLSVCLLATIAGLWASRNLL